MNDNYIIVIRLNIFLSYYIICLLLYKIMHSFLFFYYDFISNSHNKISGSFLIKCVNFEIILTIMGWGK